MVWPIGTHTMIQDYSYHGQKIKRGALGKMTPMKSPSSYKAEEEDRLRFIICRVCVYGASLREAFYIYAFASSFCVS
jgi:hypothetical protein